MDGDGADAGEAEGGGGDGAVCGGVGAGAFGALGFSEIAPESVSETEAAARVCEGVMSAEGRCCAHSDEVRGGVA
jgi:hypothetical protein